MLSVSLLGAQSVVDAATGGIRPCSARNLELLALLVSRRDVPQNRAAIAGLVWPDSGNAQALTNLRRELHQLRALVGDDGSLEVTSTHLCWHEIGHHRVDLAGFLDGAAEVAEAVAAGDDAAVLTRGMTTLDCYRGPLLPAADASWIDELRVDLDRRCASVCDTVVQAAMRLGRHPVALAALRRRIVLDRYDEPSYRTLMRIQATVGDRGGAITTFHRLANLLERDLSVEPDPRTTALLGRLLGGTPDSRTGEPGALPADPDLVGRGTELARLQRIWAHACTGCPTLVVVRGGAGVGKSRLVDEVRLDVSRQGAAVAVGHCFETGGRLSLAPVADWLREPAMVAARDRLEPAWRAEVNRLVPVDPAVGTDQKVDAWQRHRFFEGVGRALLAPGRPTLLVLDNAQWADLDTLDFVRFLLALARGAPLLLAATVRPSAAPAESDVERWLTRLRDERLAEEITLYPLDRGNTVKLATALSGHTMSDRDADEFYDATGGFPLYLVEAVRGNVVDRRRQADGWHSILRKRIEQLSPAAREVAGLAAALGRGFTIPLLVDASDLDPEIVVAAVDELWRQRVVREVGNGYEFSHDLLREEVYAAVNRPRRWLLHRRLAQALERKWAPNTDAVAAEIAAQYRLADNPERALEYYERAATMASSVFAHQQAIAMLDAARDLLSAIPDGRERDQRELSLLEQAIPPINAHHGYSSVLLRDVCERSLELAVRVGDQPRAIAVRTALWASRFVEGRIDESYRIAEQTVALVRPGDAHFGEAQFALAGSALHRGQPGSSDEHFATALASMGDEALRYGARARVHTLAWWSHAACALGQPERAVELATAAVDEANHTGHQYSLVVARAYQAVTWQLLGRRPQCRDAAADVRELCARYQFTYYGEWGAILQGWADADAAGVRLMREGLVHLRTQGAYARMPYWLGLLAQRLPEPRAGDVLAEARAIAARTHERWASAPRTLGERSGS